MKFSQLSYDLSSFGSDIILIKFVMKLKEQDFLNAF